MDYSQYFSASPYGWTQAEKEQTYISCLNELTAYHHEHCAPYGKALDAWGYAAATATELSQIPMIPITLFKQLDLTSIPQQNIFKIITSSGTSGQAVSHIYLDAATAQNQQLALYAIWKDFFGPRRLPMLIIDSPAVFHDRAQFNARGAAILGFSLFAKRKYYALTDDMELNISALDTVAALAAKGPVIIFGFTFMIWKYFCQALAQQGTSFDFSTALVLHGGGWKKLQNQAVSPAAFNTRLQEQFHISHVHNYYGMAEQTGCIYMECEYGHLHASIFSDILIRDPADFSCCPIGTSGIIQVMSPIAASYPGHSILTEDMGTLLGTDDCPCGRKGRYFRIDGRIPKAEIRGCSDTHE
ncbi:MAG: acyl-protein synthetase [Megasphaera sp.]|jgi:phenylacetate-coenzyme A ligase PaaK-like adenylate-forming protein|nr:acyl-protein synthetase [Megasphaera sp.]MCH4188116.1 acyl-protein synthetase [Megasphaera sp.]MCH4217954.1 acyl-protein synthetase [Megasphaera sp.]